jgi:hypothetical protein
VVLIREVETVVRIVARLKIEKPDGLRLTVHVAGRVIVDHVENDRDPVVDTPTTR